MLSHGVLIMFPLYEKRRILLLPFREWFGGIVVSDEKFRGLIFRSLFYVDFLAVGFIAFCGGTWSLQLWWDCVINLPY